MADLVELFVVQGCTAVRHYIRSGNIVFDAPATLSARIPEVVSAVLKKSHGFSSPVMLPRGVATSKLTNAYFDGKLGVVSTFRNWRTVLKLADMANEL